VKDEKQIRQDKVVDLFISASTQTGFTVIKILELIPLIVYQIATKIGSWFGRNHAGIHLSQGRNYLILLKTYSNYIAKI
jgi:hypothetical protein